MKGRILEVAIEAWPPASSPVRRCPIIDSGAGAQEAEEDVAGGLDHNAYVPMPGDQVSGLGLSNPLEIFYAIVQVRRAGVGIGKTRSLVNGMREMRAVVRGMKARPAVEGGSENRKSVICTHRAGLGANRDSGVLGRIRSRGRGGAILSDG